MDIHKITVVGAGSMGPDIALSFAMGGYEVSLVDLSEKILIAATERVKLNCLQLAQEQIISKEKISTIESSIKYTLDWDRAVSSADFITEAVPEKMDIKQEIFRKCDELCDPSVIIASNTSSMSITQIASKMKHPERAICTHWVIPAHICPTVEVVQGKHTSDFVSSFVLDLLKSIGKRPVICKDTPGFIHNYIQFAMVKAALDLLENEVATAEDIDSAVINGFGLRLSTVGPIHFIDLCGLDIFADVQKYLFDNTNNLSYESSKIIEKLKTEGKIGIKSGRGFYKYDSDDHKEHQFRVNQSLIKVLRAVYTV